jgi:hypothetical protein
VFIFVPDVQEISTLDLIATAVLVSDTGVVLIVPRPPTYNVPPAPETPPKIADVVLVEAVKLRDVPVSSKLPEDVSLV